MGLFSCYNRDIFKEHHEHLKTSHREIASNSPKHIFYVGWSKFYSLLGISMVCGWWCVHDGRQVSIIRCFGCRTIICRLWVYHNQRNPNWSFTG